VVSLLLKRQPRDRRDEEGQALVEYGLILSLITLACMVALVAVAGSVGSLYDVALTIVDAIADAIAGG
jgi:Flp pilus assembly pilin Flp